jgi:hypothetical protein
MKNIKQMKNYKITKLFFALCFLLAFASCESNDDVLEVRITENIFHSTSFSLKLIELTEDRMVFSSGNKGAYKRALIFKKN